MHLVEVEATSIFSPNIASLWLQREGKVLSANGSGVGGDGNGGGLMEYSFWD